MFKCFTNCFHCSVYSHMEQLAEDTLYFLLKSGLQDRIQFDHQANANKQTDNSEQR